MITVIFDTSKLNYKNSPEIISLVRSEFGLEERTDNEMVKLDDILALNAMRCFMLLDKPKEVTSLLSENYNAFQRSKIHAEILFLQTLTILGEVIKKNHPEIYEFCIGFVKVLKNEVEVDPKFFRELSNPDNIIVDGLSAEFIR